MNIWDVLIGGGLTVSLLLAVRNIYRQRKKGGCCGDCRDCAARGGCAHRP